jgi:hypothetical protein
MRTETDIGSPDPPEEYLTTASERGNLPLRTSREYYCEDCHLRVTRRPDGDGEYGHHPQCEHSIRDRDPEWDGGPETHEEGTQ